MDDHGLNRRQILAGLGLAAGTAALLEGLGTRNAGAADAPGYGPAQAPTITDVKDKVAYITGGSSGIGLGIARVLHEAGAKVVLGYIDDKQIVDALKLFPANDPRVHSIMHDVMDRDGWQRTADEIEKKYGPLHILVNNAGVGLQAPASTGTYKDWEWGLGVNLWGPIHGVHTFVPRMLASKQGSHIVTTTSTSGILPGSGAGIYTVSKIAAVGLMEELRHELRETNIGTSAFVPGLTTTNIGRSEDYRPAALKNDGPPAVAPGAQPRPAGGAGRAPPRVPRGPQRVARLGPAAGSAGGRPLRARWHPAQRPVHRAAARISPGRRGAMQCAAGIHGPVQAHASGDDRRQLLPHADLRAGDRASHGDAEAGHPGNLKKS